MHSVETNISKLPRHNLYYYNKKQDFLKHKDLKNLKQNT